jgi:SAM-dependent methyltransferase
MSEVRPEAMKEYYEQVWERLPGVLEPPDFEIRRRFLLREARRGDRALDLGCGAGAFTVALAEAGADVVGVEIAETALARARAAHEGLDFRLATLDGPLPFEDGAFDLVWASEVIEHVADTERWLSEVRRVMTPGARLLVTTPSHGRLRVAVLGVERFSEPFGDHLHLYTRRSLTSTLTELSFDHVKVRRAGGPPMARRLLLARAIRPAP